MHRILVADPLHPIAFELFAQSGVQADSLSQEDRPRLAELLVDYDALVVRSSTQVTADLLAASDRLKVVGRAGIGVDNVDVKAATARGVLVVNAPTGNLISATEHTFALMLALVRNVAAADAALKRGEWGRKRFIGAELQEKTLGVIGFGRIGQQVALRAQAFDMKVLAFDPYLDPEVARRMEVESLELDELLGRSDVVTLHTPLTDGTRGLLSAQKIAAMKPGALLVNCARGGLVDEGAVVSALDSGALAGAAFDVFAEEPPTDRRLAAHPKVVATPHIGAQTHEAQERIATQTVRMVLSALDGSLNVSAVNLPFRSTGLRGEPFLALGQQLGRLAGALVDGSFHRLQVDLWGLDEGLQAPISVAVVRGALERFMGEGVNYVNAEAVATERGVRVVRATHQAAPDYPHLVEVTVEGPEGSMVVAGTLFGGRDPRVVRFEGFPLEFKPEGRLLVLHNRDVPGVVGKLGTLLGEGGVNIAGIHLARHDTESAVAVLRIDDAPSAAVRAEVEALPEVNDVRYVDLSPEGVGAA